MSDDASVQRVELPPKLIDVFAGTADVRGAYGGRGSGKTRSFAKMAAVRALMWDAAGREGVVVCARERLNSLDDSSMAEVKSAIQSEPWLAPHFDVGAKYIRTASGRVSFKFAGLDPKTAQALKSKAKVLLLWADEAEPITDAAWDIVLPTLREEDAELWVTWNPARKSSATDRRFRQAAPDPRVKVVEINWRDNPRFPQRLERQRQKWQRDDPDSYGHVWEGEYCSTNKGAYYKTQIDALRQQGRLGNVAADPTLQIRVFVDIGGTGRNADAFSMWIVQFVGREIRVLDYYESVGQEVGHHLQWLRGRGWGPERAAIWLPHDGATHDKVFSVSYQSALERAGYSVTVVPNQGKGAAMTRILAARRVWPSVWMHAETTRAGLDALAWYHERWDDERDVGLGPMHDWASHAADAWGLMAIVAEDAMRSPAAGLRRDSQIKAPKWRRGASPMAV